MSISSTQTDVTLEAGKRYLDWDLDDPAGGSVEHVRPIRDEIDHLVRALLAELTAEPGTGRSVPY